MNLIRYKYYKTRLCINKNINFEFIIVDTKIYKEWKIKNKIKYEKI